MNKSELQTELKQNYNWDKIQIKPLLIKTN